MIGHLLIGYSDITPLSSFNLIFQFHVFLLFKYSLFEHTQHRILFNAFTPSSHKIFFQQYFASRLVVTTSPSRFNSTSSVKSFSILLGEIVKFFNCNYFHQSCVLVIQLSFSILPAHQEHLENFKKLVQTISASIISEFWALVMESRHRQSDNVNIKFEQHCTKL